MKSPDQVKHNDFLLNLIKIFKEHGFEAEKILEEQNPTPDLKVQDSNLTYFIELKIIDNPDDSEELKKYLENLEKSSSNSKSRIRKEGEVLIDSHHMGGNKGYPKRLEKALTQVHSGEEAKNCIKIVWIHSSDFLHNSSLEHAKTYIYGITTIIPRIGEGETKNCYFFSEECGFFLPLSKENKVFDGVIISRGAEVCLCLNPFSRFYDEIKNSKLATMVKGWCFDPLELERKGEIYIVSLEADRTSRETKFSYLQRKYNLGDLDCMIPEDIRSTHYFIQSPNLV